MRLVPPSGKYNLLWIDGLSDNPAKSHRLHPSSPYVSLTDAINIYKHIGANNENKSTDTPNKLIELFNAPNDNSSIVPLNEMASIVCCAL